MAESMQSIFYPLLWLLLAVGLIIAEAVSVQLFAIWFALGSLAALVPALFSAPFWVQALVFAAVSAIAMLLFRPFVKRFLRPRSERTNADRVIGETAIVLEEINNLSSQGRVSVMGLDWSARSVDGNTIPAGESVTVQALDGVKLMVSPLITVSTNHHEEAFK